MRATICFLSAFFFLLVWAGSPASVMAHEGHKMEHNHPYPTKTFDLRNGQKLYRERCAACHGIKGDGNGPASAALKPRPTDFLDLKYMPMLSRVDLYESISKGRPGTAMPPWKGMLSEEDIWDVIAYIEHLFNHQTAKEEHKHTDGREHKH